MALNLYRRHFRIAGKCPGGHAPDSISYEADELRRAWKKCHCPIYAGGTLAGHFHRRNTGHLNWTDAKTLAAAWENAGSWHAVVPPPSQPAPVVATPVSDKNSSISIAASLDAYLLNRKTRNIGDSTLRKYQTFKNQLNAFAGRKGYTVLDQFTVVDMDEFYAG